MRILLLNVWLQVRKDISCFSIKHLRPLCVIDNEDIKQDQTSDSCEAESGWRLFVNPGSYRRLSGLRLTLVRISDLQENEAKFYIIKAPSEPAVLWSQEIWDELGQILWAFTAFYFGNMLNLALFCKGINCAPLSPTPSSNQLVSSFLTILRTEHEILGSIH